MKLSLSKILTPVIALAVLAVVIVAPHRAFAITGDVTGYACSQNIGCISLNPVTSSGTAGYPTSGFGVQYDTTANTFSGTGYSLVFGTVDFGVACPSNIVSAEGAPANGNKCASIPVVAGQNTQLTGGWNGIIYMGGVTLASDFVTFTGEGWEGLDPSQNGATPPDVGVGWLNFSSTGTSCLPGQCPIFQGGQGVCGSAAGIVESTVPSGSALCSQGTASAVTGSNPWSWTCTYTNNVAVPCTTITPPTPEDGQCGSTAYTCVIGSSTQVGNGNGTSVNPWTWTCSGVNGGATSSLCTATAGSASGSGTGGPLQPQYKED